MVFKVYKCIYLFLICLHTFLYSTASVKCAACHKSYHMACLKPPLARKPPKGFAWQCALCTRQEVLASSPSDSDVSNQNDTNKNTPKKCQIRATRSQLPKSRAQPQQQIITSTSLTSAIKPKASHSKKMNSKLKNNIFFKA